MKKKLLSLVLALCLLAASSSFALAETEITFWTGLSGALDESLQKIVADFNASQDEYVVTAEYQGSYYDIAAKIQAAVISGDEPDIVQMECTRVIMFAEYEIFEELTDELAEYGIDRSQFYDGFLADCDWGEGLYAIPFNRSTPMFYYNKTLFDELGLEVPTTWEEMHETAKAIAIPGERWGCEIPIDFWFYECMILQSGGSFLNEDNTDIGFNNEAGTAPLYFWREMIEDGSMKAPPGAEYNAWEAARSDFAAGTTAMIMTSTGDVSTLRQICDFELGMAFLPANEKHAACTGGANVAVLAGHEDKMDGIMAFLKYATSPEVAGWWAANTGYVPTGDAAAQTEVYQEYLSSFPMGETSLKQMDTAASQAILTEWNEICSTFIQPAIQRTIEQADYTPEQAVQDISDQVRNLLG